jgi:hypothetical protein
MGSENLKPEALASVTPIADFGNYHRTRADDGFTAGAIRRQGSNNLRDSSFALPFAVSEAAANQGLGWYVSSGTWTRIAFGGESPAGYVYPTNSVVDSVIYSSSIPMSVGAQWAIDLSATIGANGETDPAKMGLTSVWLEGKRSNDGLWEEVGTIQGSAPKGRLIPTKTYSARYTKRYNGANNLIVGWNPATSPFYAYSAIRVKLLYASFYRR